MATPTAARDIAPSPGRLDTVSHSMAVSSSPSATFYSPPASFGTPNLTRGMTAATKQLKPFATQDIKILLLENVNQSGKDILTAQGYQVEAVKSSLPEDQLIEKIRWGKLQPRNPSSTPAGSQADLFFHYCSDVHVIGIRSKTKLNEKVLRAAKNLIVVGCFCIGTNQVDLEYAARHGIAVFNSPFANSRSVAELVIGEIIVLARQLGDRSNELHKGTWNKVSSKCWEIRGKTLGLSISRTPRSVC